MQYNSEKVPIMNRSNPWLKLAIVAAVLVAGYWLFNSWGYGPLSNLRGFWRMGRGGYGGQMMGYGSGYGMGIGMLLFWGLIIFAIVSLISGLFSKRQDPSHPESQTDDALQILKKRYARGDIDKAQFDAIRRDLNV
jgi:putative membrane protein